MSEKSDFMPILDDDKAMILFAAMEGRVDIMKWLKEEGADVNAKGGDGSTPMHVAAGGGHVDAMKWLKEQGANINAKNNNGETPLSIAQTDEAKEWLRANGAEVSSSPRADSTPGYVFLGEATAGCQVMMLRSLKALTLWRGGEPVEFWDTYRDHPLYKRNPHVPASGQKTGMDEPFELIMDIPESADWIFRYYRMDFPPLKDCPYSEEGVLKPVEQGYNYSSPLTPKGIALFGVQKMKNPTCTVLMVLRSPNPDGVLSVVVSIGPGPDENSTAD